jgi:hypothetical protein
MSPRTAGCVDAASLKNRRQGSLPPILRLGAVEGRRSGFADSIASLAPVVPVASLAPVVPVASLTPVVPVASLTPVVPVASLAPVVPVASLASVVPVAPVASVPVFVDFSCLTPALAHV